MGVAQPVMPLGHCRMWRPASLAQSRHRQDTAHCIGQDDGVGGFDVGHRQPIRDRAVDQLHMSAGEPKSLMVLGGQGRPASWSHFAEYYSAVKEWFDFSMVTAGERAAK